MLLCRRHLNRLPSLISTLEPSYCGNRCYTLPGEASLQYARIAQQRDRFNFHMEAAFSCRSRITAFKKRSLEPDLHQLSDPAQ